MNLENIEIFRVEDLNQLIKIYAYKIQQRFEEILKLIPQTNNQQQQSYDVIQRLTDKYRGFSTSNPKQIIFIQKLIQRVIQIFSFFKCRSKYQHLLSIFEEKITAKLDLYLTQKPINLGQIIEFVLQTVKPGYYCKPPTAVQRKRFFIRNSSKQQSQVPFIKNIRTKSNIHNSQIISNKKQKSIIVLQKPSNQENFNNLYFMLDLDRYHFIKSIDNPHFTKKDMIGRNQATMNSIKTYKKSMKKLNTQSDYIVFNENILTDIKDRNSLKKTTGFPTNINWINKKKRIATANKYKHNQNTYYF